jgi:cytochrome b6
LGLTALTQFLSGKNVPRGRRSFWHIFGGLAMFFFSLQIITGAMLTLYYSATPATANESVHLVVDKAAYGWLVRSLHIWSSHLLIGSVIVHFFSAYFMRSYQKPREVTWITGVVLLMIVLGFGFTGYLLPWDAAAYSGTQIGTAIPKAMPIIGSVVATILRGGETVGAETLKRLYALHVTILPLCCFVVVMIHLLLVYLHGISASSEFQHQTMPLYPNHFYRDLLAWVTASIILVILCMLFPSSIGSRADPLSSAPVGIKPQWYFLPLYEAFRAAPQRLFGVGGESLVNVAILVMGILLFLIPILDRGRGDRTRLTIQKAIGILAILYSMVSVSLALFT